MAIIIAVMTMMMMTVGMTGMIIAGMTGMTGMEMITVTADIKTRTAIMKMGVI
jgi:hypothetical protein